MLPPVLRFRDLRRFYLGAVLSQTGSQFTTVAMAWQMYELTNSPLQVGLLGLCRAVPQIALAVFGGMLADALDRRRLLMVIQVGNCLVSTSLVLLTAARLISPHALLAAAVLFAFGSAAETPARQAVVPNLVPAKYLAEAVALSNTQRNVAIIVGPSLAGLALALASPALCYAIDAASWCAMLVALLFISTPLQEARRTQASLEALLGGIRFVRGQQVILSFMALDFGATFFGSSTALLPVYARDILRAGPIGLGVLYAAPAVGALAAAVAMSTYVRIDRAGRWVLLGVLAYGLAMTGFALSRMLWLSVIMLAATGAGNTVSAVLRGTSNQLLTPDYLRGRVTAVNSAFTMGGPQLGQFESGVVADMAGAPVSALTGAVATCLLAGAIALLPHVRRFTFSVDAAPVPAVASS
ncbi:MAG TPA: MFS transporter [Chloroflexota bacterium]